MGGTHPGRNNCRKRGGRAGKRVQQKKKVEKLGEGIYNLSGKHLTREEIFTLDRGIKYAPKKGLNKFQTYVGIQTFIRKLNVMKYYVQNPMERVVMEGNHTELRNNSVFNPSIANNKYVDMFKRLGTAELEKLPIKKEYEHKNIEKGIELLEKRKDTVVCPADKGEVLRYYPQKRKYIVVCPADKGGVLRYYPQNSTSRKWIKY